MKLSYGCHFTLYSNVFKSPVIILAIATDDKANCKKHTTQDLNGLLKFSICRHRSQSP